MLFSFLYNLYNTPIINPCGWWTGSLYTKFVHHSETFFFDRSDLVVTITQLISCQVFDDANNLSQKWVKQGRGKYWPGKRVDHVDIA